MKDLRVALCNTPIRITDLSRQAKISRQAIYALIQGKATPKISTIKSLCSVMGLDYKEYLPY